MNQTTKQNATDAPRGATGIGATALARSVALHLEGKRKEALTELNGAIEAGEHNRRKFWQPRDTFQFELEQFDDAVKTYEQLLEVVPRHATANFNLGICYEKLGRWQEATDSFQKSLASDPARQEAQLGLGICLLHQEKPEARSLSVASTKFTGKPVPISPQRCLEKR